MPLAQRPLYQLALKLALFQLGLLEVSLVGSPLHQLWRVGSSLGATPALCQLWLLDQGLGRMSLYQLKLGGSLRCLRMILSHALNLSLRLTLMRQTMLRKSLSQLTAVEWQF